MVDAIEFFSFFLSYRVFPGFSWVFLGLYWVLPSFGGSLKVLPGFDWFIPSFTGFYWLNKSTLGLNWVSVVSIEF